MVLAQLQNQCPQDPPGAVFEVWTEVMFVKAPPEYGERFATSLVCWLWRNLRLCSLINRHVGLNVQCTLYIYTYFLY